MQVASPALPNFEPPLWLASAHVQTTLPSLLRKPPQLSREREILHLDDGDFLELDWAHVPDPAAPTVVLIHGLTGCSGSHYILGTQQALVQRGWRSVAMNLRSATGTVNRLLRFYHGGEAGDSYATLSHVKSRFPQAWLARVGFSLGGCIFLNGFASDRGYPGWAALGLRAAAAVSVPYDLAACSEQLDRGFARVYRNHLLAGMEAMVHRKIKAFRAEARTAEAAELEALINTPRGSRFRDFDETVMAPLHGFASAEDYYQRCSPRQFLQAVDLPVLLLQAADDPFMPAGVFPDEADVSPACIRWLTQRGGHLGFVGSAPGGRPDFWMEQRLADWLVGQQRIDQDSTKARSTT